MQETEKVISRSISIKPSDMTRIENMAWAKRENFSSMILTLVMPQVEAWEREQTPSPLPEQQQA